MSGPPTAALSAAQRSALTAIVGDGHALGDDDVRAGYETDWTGRWTGRSSMVVRPADHAEVSAVLGVCDRERIEVVPQGGNTGLVGGGVPRADTSSTRPVIVLSTRRLTAVGAVDTDALQVTVGAGVTIAAWRSAAGAVGLDAPIDFAARESATIGGAIATNAGGSRVVRFGTMRHQVMGIEAVLADGRTVGSLAGLPKETVGLHWPSLFTGSEGALGVVTAARLRLVPRFDQLASALVSMATIDAAVALVGILRHRVATLDAVEVMLPAAIDVVARHIGRTSPVAPGACTLFIECAGHRDPTDDLLAALATAEGVTDTAVATDRTGRDALVQFRDRITEAIAAEATRIGIPTYKLDVAVPIAAVARLIEEAERAAADTSSRLVPFGHLAEGNLHLNYLGAPDGAAIAAAVLPRVARLGGTISAEHGVGVAKMPWLHLVRTGGELDAQTAIKRALDPHGILNPGVLAPVLPGPSGQT